mmetsp:Transcript_45658/g.105476  ORF Transcript_45658/g.105476 Transcript_45658/m.105476 type:complete len:232 (-) Transcript_45658:50-745(-)|eukprot:CAMPEP_0171105358 /NCGR_PEP_ID=MMETSP0766_2-20121228/62520_1 /TAXON_ID=439317 /ORGANISM="Gambierdiscus australes, Strain CAWD 149" /LENGTH=231 /DNA_ID=CAMNT_0011566191 /DNA_START=207 /DNA_END=902 /DNA_ORIENTATION=-
MFAASLSMLCLLGLAANVLGRREDAIESELQLPLEDGEEDSQHKLGATVGLSARTAAHGAATGATQLLSFAAIAGRHVADVAGRMAQGLSRPLSQCEEDNDGVRVGCNSSNCSCAWFEQCYPKLVQEDHLDVGVCNVAVAAMVAISVMIIGNFIAFIVVLRVYFQWRERVNTKMNETSQMPGGPLRKEHGGVSSDEGKHKKVGKKATSAKEQTGPTENSHRRTAAAASPSR